MKNSTCPGHVVEELNNLLLLIYGRICIIGTVGGIYDIYDSCKDRGSIAMTTCISAMQR